MAVDASSEHHRPWLEGLLPQRQRVVTSPVEFDALIQVFRAPADPAPAVEVIDRPASHDSDLLDDFAISAMQGMLASDMCMRGAEDQLSEQSYRIALSMMAERAKHQPK